MRAVVTILLGVMFLAAISSSLLAQDISFVSSVDRNTVGQGDQFTLSLVLNNAGMGGGKNLKLPDLSNFHIMGGPNQSTSMQFINGVVSSSITYSYILQPKEVGKFTIGSASIEAGGAVYRTEPLALEVVKGTSKPKQQVAAADDLSGQIGDNIFLKAEVDRSHVLQGDQINLVFKLYTRVTITNYAPDKSPALTGFWGEDLEIPKNIALTNEVVNGKQYRVGVIRRVALFPTQSGTLEISPMQVQTTVQVQSRSNDPFDAFFRDPFGRTVNYMVKSEPLKVKVDPLPPGAPPEFKGAVGKFTMKASVNSTTTKTNEPITLRVVISGTGNIKLLESPVVDLPADFEQYTPKITDDIRRTEGKISGSKTFEYLLIPRYPGNKSIKPVAFSYFDLGKREYVTLKSPAIEIAVEQGTASVAPLIAGGGREDVRMLNQDIRFIKTGDGALVRVGRHLHTSTVFMVLLLLPLLGFAGAVVYSRRQQAVASDLVGYRNRRAMKVAQKGLKQAEILLKRGTNGETNQKLQFYAEVSRALWKYLADKLNIQQAELSIEGTLERLSQRSVNGEVSATLRTLLESCEMARFAPTSLEDAAMRKTFEDARKLIMDLERTLRGR